MSDLIYETTGGEKYEFPQVTLAEYHNLLGRIAETVRKINRDVANEVGMNPVQRAGFLADRDPKSVSAGDVDIYLADSRNACEVLRAALAKKGKTPEESEKIVAGLPVQERDAIARHVAGLINLSPVPLENRKADAKMAALVAKHYPGVDLNTLTYGQFYDLLNALIPEQPVSPQDWFNRNVVSGTVKPLETAAA